MSSEHPEPHVTRLDLITRLEGMIHACLKDHVSPDEPVAIVDFPDIRNCGDSAIWLGEMAYLQNRFGKRPAYVSRIRDFSPDTLAASVPRGPVFIHGGGNFGDVWPGRQAFRESVLERLQGRPVIQFPQSIHYQSESGIARTARIIAKHKQFVLFVRDVESKEFAEKHFDCPVHLCPDMAFAIGPLAPRPSDVPVLAMLREDSEKVERSAAWAYPEIPKEDWITESRNKVRMAKARAALSSLLKLQPSEMRLSALDAAANNRFERGITQIAHGKAILTDRLHVHICSILLDRPHAVLDNNYGKIRRFMDAFSGGTALSYRATSLDDAVQWARAQASA